MASLQLGDSLIEANKAFVYFIAEIGQNHQGDVKIAKRMIRKAKEAGCHCVKFQKSCLPKKFTKSALARKYDGPNSWGKTYGEHKQFLEFSIDQYKELQQYSRELGIDFTASAMDEVSLQQLDELDVPFIKIGSGDANNIPMLEKAARLKRPLVISTGMVTMKDVERIVEIMSKAKKTNYALMHCVSAYPTPRDQANLTMVAWMRHIFPDVVIGYSGHEVGLNETKAAALLGARIIERHFTLDRTWKGSDHACSLIPKQMALLIRQVGELCIQAPLEPLEELDQEKYKFARKLGNAVRTFYPKGSILSCELSCKQKLGKSIVAARNLRSGHRITRKDICIKVSEPNGIPPEKYYDVLSTKLRCKVKEDEPILQNYVINGAL